MSLSLAGALLHCEFSNLYALGDKGIILLVVSSCLRPLFTKSDPLSYVTSCKDILRLPRDSTKIKAQHRSNDGVHHIVHIDNGHSILNTGL